MMIDDEREAHELVEALNGHLPMRAYATPPLAESLRGQGADIEPSDPLQIDSVLYLGDEGGVACSLGLPGGKTAVIASITHLRIDGAHPLARQIEAYRLRRSQRLASPVSSSAGSAAGISRTPKRETVHVAPRAAAAKNDPMRPVPGAIPRQFPRDELRELPLRRETWQVGLMLRADDALGEQARLWLLGVANVSGREMRAATVIDQPLTEALVWNQMIEAFLSPVDGEPARPSTLVVCRREFRDAWEPLLSEIGVRCRFVRDPQPVARLLEAMSDVVSRPEPPRAADIDIREFPQSDAVWQADFFRSPTWVTNAQKEPYRPWSMLVLEKVRSSALMTCHTAGEPAPEMLLDCLVRTMARPGKGPPQRPLMVEVSDSDCYDHLLPRLESAGVACRLVDELTEFNAFCLRLAKSCDGAGKCSLADGRGVTRPQMESFYEAAEACFRRAPWQYVPGELPIEIRCDDPAMGTRYGIVLGRTGVQLGLCICDDREMAQALICGYAAPDEHRALTVCYDEAQIMAAVDLQLIERLGWPIAGRLAWPAVMRLQPRRMPRSASQEELLYLDACLRAIPDFVEAQAASSSRQVQTGTRPVTLRLAWDQHSIRHW